MPEQVALFLVAVRQGASNRTLQELFQRSGDTVSRLFNRVLDALTCPAVYNAYIQLPENRIPDDIRAEPRFYPWFKDCLAAIDGSHTPAHPDSEEKVRFRDRKGDVSMNVLAACTFDMRFCYVLSGWEGSAADSSVFHDARAHDLLIPAGKYYLADAGFSSCDVLLVPYRGVQYHLREWHAVRNRRPANYKELFNYRHAGARNIIERIFGVFKKRFPAIKNGTEYPMSSQARIFPACAVIHNFIRTHDPDDWSEVDSEEEHSLEDARDGEGELGEGYVIRSTETIRANKRRDTIAKAMWEDYQM